VGTDFVPENRPLGLHRGGSCHDFLRPSDAGSFSTGRKFARAHTGSVRSPLSGDVSETPEDHGRKRCCDARHIRGEILCV
jgi:hypothetical protein